ncbi:MAG: DUF433 domain-containing protein [Pirellulales bacterium]|nr:DUF433 domain-containing protein [Pirellulales bacterium]
MQVVAKIIKWGYWQYLTLENLPSNLTECPFFPAVMAGKPCIRGMRVTMGTVLGLLSSGYSSERILQGYPFLEAEDIDGVFGNA